MVAAAPARSAVFNCTVEFAANSHSVQLIRLLPFRSKDELIKEEPTAGITRKLTDILMKKN
jgi:hypothetical protein